VNAELAMMWKWLWPVFRFEHLKYEVWSITLCLLGQKELKPALIWDFYSIEFWFVNDVLGHQNILVTGYHFPLHKISEERISDLH
jgi:hypothetical protein